MDSRADNQPSDNGDGPAGDERSGKSAQHRAQHPADDERKNKDDGNVLLNACNAASALCLTFRQRLAVDYADDLVDPGRKAVIEASLREARRNGLADDALAGGVIECSLEAVPHLDAQRAVGLGNDQDRAVINLLAAQLPLFHDPQRHIARSFQGPWWEQ